MIAIAEIFKNDNWVIPTIFLGGGIVAGLVFESILMPLLRRVAANTKIHFDDELLGSLRGIGFILLTMLGVHFALIACGDSISERTMTTAQRILIVIVIASITLFAARFAVAVLQDYSKKSGKSTPSISIFTNITRLAFFILGFLVILQALDIPITPILTALGIGGLAVALALQDTLSNLFAGLHIIASRQVHSGDYIKLESGEEGYVTDISWRNTTIKALANNMIIVPNTKLASAIIINYYQPDREMGLPVQVGVSYSSDLEKVERVSIEVAREVLQRTQGGVKNFEPFVRFHTFSDFSINFSVVLRVNEFVDQHLVKHEFVKALHKRYAQEGIEIPFPIRTIIMKNTEAN